MVKLNLGSGIYYKPGYVNIDKFEESVADENFDIVKLPYEDESIEEIEASHILEHFDITWLPFILAEWFRVLKPGGIIYIETPDLRKTVRKINYQNYQRSKYSVRFLFGVDLPGNYHKAGFTSSFLKKTLKLTGFSKIKKQRQTSFLQEKGLRIKAIKPINLSINNKEFFLSNFRWKIVSQIDNLDIGYLEAIENNCFSPLIKLLAKDITNFFNMESIVFFASTFSILNPTISKIFLSIVPERVSKQYNLKFLDYLMEIDFPSLLLSNWISRKKEIPDISSLFIEMYSYWTEKIKKSLLSDINFKETTDYFSTREAVICDFFSPEIINLRSLKLANQGLKKFLQNDLTEAEKYLKCSLRYNPSNFVASWNLARLYILLKESKEKILKFYEQAEETAVNSNIRKQIKNEKNCLQYEKMDEIDLIPIQLRS